MQEEIYTCYVVALPLIWDYHCITNTVIDELCNIKRSVKKGVSSSLNPFVEQFEYMACFISDIAWVAVEKDIETGKQLIKLYDIAFYFAKKWRDKNIATVDELKEIEKPLDIIKFLAERPHYAKEWDELEKLTDADEFAKAGTRYTTEYIKAYVDSLN